MEALAVREWLKTRLGTSAALEKAVSALSKRRQKPGENRTGGWLIDRRGEVSDAPARVVYDLAPAGDDTGRCGQVVWCRLAMSVELVFDGSAAQAKDALTQLHTLLEGVSASDATYEWDISRTALIDEQESPAAGGWLHLGALWLVEVRKK